MNSHQHQSLATSVGAHQRAVVIGGGSAGLLASRVLSEHFDQVVLLERDRYPTGPTPRAGVPQGDHVHLLLLRGKRILERLFPGLSQELIEGGACVVEMGHELGVLSYHGWRVSYQGGLELLTFTQPLLERCLRRRLDQIPQIEIFEGLRVTGLLAADGGAQVTGARCQFVEDPSNEVNVEGNLVVDASGRFSEAPTWLTELGYPPVEKTVVDPYLGYASRLYERPAPPDRAKLLPSGWKALLFLGEPPNKTRAGVLLPVEGNRWHVTLIGISEDYPPTDEGGFLEFARTLRSRILFEAIKEARPASRIVGNRSTRNRLRHFESLPQWPEQFVVLGDAVCAFNPSYGQGMSVAAVEAEILDRTLRQFPPMLDNRTSRSARFQQDVTEAFETPWLLATSNDFRWPATEGDQLGGLPISIAHRYLNAVNALATEDPEVDRTLAQVAHLTKPAAALLHPRIALRALGWMLRALFRGCI